MVLSTPSSQYEEATASKILKQFGETEIVSASRALLNEGVLSKTVYDPAKKRPGRMLRISDAYALDLDRHRITEATISRNQSALEGPFSSVLYQDAKEVKEQLSSTSDNWSPLASEGETAGLLQLISSNTVCGNLAAKPN